MKLGFCLKMKSGFVHFRPYEIIANFFQWYFTIFEIKDVRYARANPLTNEMIFHFWTKRLVLILTHVCSSVCPELFSKTGHSIFPKLGLKLQDHNGHYFFPGKISFGRKSTKPVKIKVF